jgi:hypothetical protein
MRDAKVAQTARERRQRQKAKQKERQAAKREQVAKYATHAYNGVDTPVSKVDVELWCAKAVDLQQAFIRLAGEVTQRCAEEAHKQGRHTKAVSLRFSTKPYSVSVLTGSEAAVVMEPVELSTDLLMLISQGLSEERLQKLLRRWSKLTARDAGGGGATDDAQMHGNDSDEPTPSIFD